MNSEAHRQFYLETAGIRMWYARRPLPGAAPSPAFDFQPDEPDLLPEPEAMTAQPPHAASGVGEARPRVERSVDLQSLMAPQSDSSDSPAQLKSAHRNAIQNSVAEQADAAIAQRTVAVSEPAIDADPLQANLGIWATGQYLLVSQWSSNASESLQDLLAKSVLKALLQTNIEDRKEFHWPVFGNPNLPGNSRRDFYAVLKRLLAQYEPRSVILLGVLKSEPDTERTSVLAQAQHSLLVDFPNSLAELSASPVHKRGLWNALKSETTE